MGSEFWVLGCGVCFTGGNRENEAGVFTAKYAKKREGEDQTNPNSGFFHRRPQRERSESGRISANSYALVVKKIPVRFRFRRSYSRSFAPFAVKNSDPDFTGVRRGRRDGSPRLFRFHPHFPFRVFRVFRGEKPEFRVSDSNGPIRVHSRDSRAKTPTRILQETAESAES